MWSNSDVFGFKVIPEVLYQNFDNFIQTEVHISGPLLSNEKKSCVEQHPCCVLGLHLVKCLGHIWISSMFYHPVSNSWFLYERRNPNPTLLCVSRRTWTSWWSCTKDWWHWEKVIYCNRWAAAINTSVTFVVEPSQPLVLQSQTWLRYHSAGWEKTLLLAYISLNQSQSSWASLSPGCSSGASDKYCQEETCFSGTFACGEGSTVIKIL